MQAFEVMCIDGQWTGCPGLVVPCPKFGDIDWVIEVVEEENVYYVLARYPVIILWNSSHFVLLGGPCEIDIAEKRIEEECEALDMEFAELVGSIEGGNSL